MAKYIITNDQTLIAVMDVLRSINFNKGWEVDIRRRRAKRSLDQNALYWKWVGIIANETGNDKDTIHDVLRNKFLGREVTTALDEVIERLPTTTKLSTGDFSIYMTKIEAFASQELGIRLPSSIDLYEE